MFQKCSLAEHFLGSLIFKVIQDYLLKGHMSKKDEKGVGAVNKLGFQTNTHTKNYN